MPRDGADGLEVVVRCPAAVQHEDRNYGGTIWVALRARNSEWTLLTAEEAGALGAFLSSRYPPQG